MRRRPLRHWALCGAFLFSGCYCAHVPQHRAAKVRVVDERKASDTVRLGVVAGAALREIERQWNGTDAYQVERAKCVAEYSVSHTPHSGLVLETYAVTVFDSAKVDSASQGRIVYDCGGRPRFHTHPPSICAQAFTPLPALSCSLTSAYERNCRPSETDQRVLARLQHPFALVQCGARTVTFYFPPPLSSLSTNDSIPLQIIQRIPHE